jgi:formamidopyrimidine-DNA glycosylase
MILPAVLSFCPHLSAKLVSSSFPSFPSVKIPCKRYCVPELPEVEILVRHLRPLLLDQTVREVQVRRPKVLAPTPVRTFTRTLRGARFASLTRRGKYLLFTLHPAGNLAAKRHAPAEKEPLTLLGHLGMTGRMYLLPTHAKLPKHASVVLGFDREQFVFEDTRYFGRFTLDIRPLENLGPEPLGEDFQIEPFAQALKRSAQAIKIKLLDQSLVAGIGNIYASEALFRAGVSPKVPARKLPNKQISRLWRAIREVLAEAIECGSTVPLSFSGNGAVDGLFYFGRAAGTPDYYQERLRVYDQAGRPCPTCGTAIRRIVQAARSTYYCPRCQRA